MICLILSWIYCSIIERELWAISIYTGANPYELSPHPLIQKHPALKASDVTDAPAFFIADPFMVKHNGIWYMFFEVLNETSHQGDIGLASSPDGIIWRYEKIVLDESFHLSYPYVFKSADTFYMIPETNEAHSIRLYKASEFPAKWTFAAELIQGNFSDPSLIFKDGKWWLFALKDFDKLALYYSDDLYGQWKKHPASPLIKNDKNISRPGGRLIILGNKLVRYAQDDDPIYGAELNAFIVDELTTTTYREHPAPQNPILKYSETGWNATGMHHIDAHQIKDDYWLACVDGKKHKKIFDGRLGIKRLLDKFKEAAQ